MKNISAELGMLIVDFRDQLASIPAESWNHKPLADKWSKKEIIGHLIDSAQNNIRRFIVAQYEDTPEINYNQVEWVKLSNYQVQSHKHLVDLWYLLNKNICIILENMKQGNEKKTCMTKQVHDLEWLANDYIKHLKHHIHQVLELDEVPYP